MASELEDAVYHKLVSLSDICINNISPSIWFECDILRITKTMYFHEYEIKKSRVDFFNDFKKGRFSTKAHLSTEPWEKKHYRLAQGDTDGPARFYFVTEPGLVEREEVPDHCGLLYLEKHGLITIKAAPILHREKVSKEFLMMVLRGFNGRVFKMKRGYSHA